MVYLLLSIACSTAIVLLFKAFNHFQIQNLPAITVNYAVCVLCAWLTLGAFPLATNITEQVWFPYAMVLGFVFITGFNLGASTVRIFSVTIGAVMQKMSLVITVIYTTVAFAEPVTLVKVLGILAAAAAIILINLPVKKDQKNHVPRPWYLYLIPVGTLITSALMEILLFRVERITGQNADLSFLATLFSLACMLGVITLAAGFFFSRQHNLVRGKDILAGIILGVINFGSIYFLLKVIGIGWDGSVVFPVNNVAIIACAAPLAVWIFREKLSTNNKIGLLLAVVAIALIALSA
ncbi:MAG: hypothetical protein HRU40_14885 [Saprospiraceae bacterium]|nr:hypothetical protein [Saprospiraceae bacterium]